MNHDHRPDTPEAPPRPRRTPFFARFLGRQRPRSERDERDGGREVTTLKHPSDQDDDGTGAV